MKDDPFIVQSQYIKAGAGAETFTLAMDTTHRKAMVNVVCCVDMTTALTGIFYWVRKNGVLFPFGSVAAVGAGVVNRITQWFPMTTDCNFVVRVTGGAALDIITITVFGNFMDD